MARIRNRKKYYNFGTNKEFCMKTGHDYFKASIYVMEQSQVHIF